MEELAVLSDDHRRCLTHFMHGLQATDEIATQEDILPEPEDRDLKVQEEVQAVMPEELRPPLASPKSQSGALPALAEDEEYTGETSSISGLCPHLTPPPSIAYPRNRNRVLSVR